MSLGLERILSMILRRIMKIFLCAENNKSPVKLSYAHQQGETLQIHLHQIPENETEHQ